MKATLFVCCYSVLIFLTLVATTAATTTMMMMSTDTDNRNGETVPANANPPEAVAAVPPSPNTAKKIHKKKKKEHHFVFGYGSLICEKSRSITNPTLGDKPGLPVVIQNVERVWSARTKTGYTAMGVRFSQDKECTGVLIEVDAEELADLDKREANYDRRPIQLENIDQVPFLDEDEFYDDDHPVFDAKEQLANSSDDGICSDDHNNDDGLHQNVHAWIYIQRDPIPADPSHPIPQSYVDIILRGALSISDEFAKSIIDTTSGWEHSQDHWVDDREVPIYKRADSKYSNTHGETIDNLLEEHHPDAYEERVEYDPLEHLEALADALQDDKAHPASIAHVVRQVKKDAAAKIKDNQEG